MADDMNNDVLEQGAASEGMPEDLKRLLARANEDDASAYDPDAESDEDEDDDEELEESFGANDRGEDAGTDVNGGSLQISEFGREMKQSFIEYSMSVITARALPDVRDGLKPVHRRILYAMNESGIFPNRPHKKSAWTVGDVRDGLKPVHRRILYAMNESGIFPNRPHKKSAWTVGDVIGKYQPPGDSAVYDTRVRLAQWFSMRTPLIDGHGNFGYIDGDGAAAMRYTESRLAKPSMELLRDLQKYTVDWQPNYDRRLAAQLRRVHRPTHGAALTLPQPPGQRLPGHRCRHGHQHRPAQHGRGRRGHLLTHRPP